MKNWRMCSKRSKDTCESLVESHEWNSIESQQIFVGRGRSCASDFNHPIEKGG